MSTEIKTELCPLIEKFLHIFIISLENNVQICYNFTEIIRFEFDIDAEYRGDTRIYEDGEFVNTTSSAER